MLQSMGSQSDGHNLLSEQQQGWQLRWFMAPIRTIGSTVTLLMGTAILLFNNEDS